jgi:hypothetical protein
VHLNRLSVVLGAAVRASPSAPISSAIAEGEYVAERLLT